MMKICYIDESGCTGILPSATSNIQPVLAIVGIILDYSALHDVTGQLMNLKVRFFPGTVPSRSQYLDRILTEIKGSELRKNACHPGRAVRRHTFGFLNNFMSICENANAKLVGRVWIKGIGIPFDGTAVYTSSMQSIYKDFQNLLESTNDEGFVIVDSRLKHLNTPVAHSIFTQKFKNSGDNYGRILELPAFSHSDNHAGLQLADKMCSALIVPLAVHSYCSGHIQSVHVRPGYAEIKNRYGIRIRLMQHRYQEASGKWRGGLIVSDGLTQQSGGRLFA